MCSIRKRALVTLTNLDLHVKLFQVFMCAPHQVGPSPIIAVVCFRLTYKPSIRNSVFLLYNRIRDTYTIYYLTVV